MKINRFNKWIFFCLILSFKCFGVEKNQSDWLFSSAGNQSSYSGWFFGIGSGVGLEPLKTAWLMQNKVENKTFPTFLFQAKIGGYHYFNPWAGLRYYYNYDFSFNPGEEAYANFFAPVVNYPAEGGFTLFGTHTLNFDVIFNPFTGETFDFGLIFGMGAGITDGLYSMKFKTTYYPERGSYFTAFEARVNVGMRFLFHKRYAIEFLSKIPLRPYTPIAQSGSGIGEYGVNQKRGGKLLYKGSYHLTLDFVMEL